MGEFSVVGELFETLSHPYRRQLLVALLEHNPQSDSDVDPLDLFATPEGTEALEVELKHVHLPELASKGFITWNRSTGEISKGPNWEMIRPILELIQEHQDEFPGEFP